MLKLLKPFENLNKRESLLLPLSWAILFFTTWAIYSSRDGTHIFPTLSHVLEGLGDLWNEGLVTHVFSSLALCFKAVILSVVISLILSYLSVIPIFKPISRIISKFRYLPLTGISFYITMLVNNARDIQIWLLMLFMTTYLVTSILGVISDIDEEEFNHARALGCTRWEILLEVVIKGRLDYVLESIRQNFAMIWFALVTVESILVASGGIGVLIKNSNKFLDHGRIVALQIIILLIGVIIDKALKHLRKVLFRYSEF